MLLCFFKEVELSWLLVLGLYKEDYLQIFKFVSFCLHGFCNKWESWDPVNRLNHTSLVAIVTPSDRPKSVRNRCVIKVFGGVFYVVKLLFGFFCGCRGFCHRTESDLFLFLLLTNNDAGECDRVPCAAWCTGYRHWSGGGVVAGIAWICCCTLVCCCSVTGLSIGYRCWGSTIWLENRDLC